MYWLFTVVIMWLLLPGITWETIMSPGKKAKFKIWIQFLLNEYHRKVKKLLSRNTISWEQTVFINGYISGAQFLDTDVSKVGWNAIKKKAKGWLDRWPGPLLALRLLTRGKSRGFPGGLVVKNPPANAGNKSLVLDLGRSHVPWKKVSPRATSIESVL